MCLCLKKYLPLLCLFVVTSFNNIALGKPTASREWKTKSGHTTTAIATQVTDGKVHLKKTNGSVIKVDLNLLTDKDIALIKTHFDLSKTKEPDSPKGSNAQPLTDLSQPQGKVVGPIESDGSHYFLYLPKSLKKNRLAPLLFYTHSGGGGGGKLIKQLQGGADALGWIMAMSVESKNQNPNSGKVVAKNMKHILENWPVDKNRIHYTGNSGGGARAFYNSAAIRAYGVIPNVGYIPSGLNIKTEVIYGLGGGNDYNRYLTAYAVKTVKKDGFHRMSPKGHGVSPANFYIDGMIWMHCKYMKKNKTKLRDEAADFEASIIKWINRIKLTNSERAYSTACVVRDIYEISSSNTGILNSIIKDLAKDQNNVLYHEGLLDINELSMKHFASLGEDGGSKMNHSNPQATKAAQKLKEKYSSVKTIMDVLNTIMKKTVSP